MAGIDPIVQEAIDFFKLVSNAELEQRQKEMADLEFEAGEHWDPKVKADRLAAGKPCLEIDLLSGPLNQIEGQSNESRAGITISAKKVGTSPEAASLLQGFVRDIEQQSNALDVYAHAVRRCSRAGRAGWRIVSEYEDDESFNQVLRIKWVDNWFQVYLDPTYKEQDGSDRKKAIIVDDLTHDAYTERFGESELAASLGGTFQSIGDAPAEWLTKDRVRIAEFFKVKETKRVRLQLSNGQELYEDELPTTGKGKKVKPVLPDGISVTNRRKVTEKTCCWYLINAVEILDKRELPIPYIPIVEIEGERRNINGKVDRRGVVRMGKQLNQMADFHETALVEEVDVGRSSPWVAEWSQVAPYSHLWENPKKTRVLYYNATAADGKPLPPPFRDTAEPPIQATVIAAQRAEQLLRAVTGVPDVFAEETKKEQSGRAILARQRQQEQGSSKYLVSRNRGIAYTGKIFLAWAAPVYDTPRVGHITDKHEKERSIVTHRGQQQLAQKLAMEQEIPETDILDLANAAKYDVTATAGKAYATERQETVDLVTNALPVIPPPMVPKALSVLFKNSDGPGMQELATAFEPPQQQIPPEVQQRLVQLDQFAQIATEQINQLKDQLADKDADRQSKEQIASEGNASQEKIALAKIELDAEKMRMEFELEQQRISADVEKQRIQAEQARIAMAHERAMGAQGAVYESAGAERAHEFAAEDAERSHGHAKELLKAKPKANGKGE